MRVTTENKDLAKLVAYWKRESKALQELANVAADVQEQNVWIVRADVYRRCAYELTEVMSGKELKECALGQTRPT